MNYLGYKGLQIGAFRRGGHQIKAKETLSSNQQKSYYFFRIKSLKQSNAKSHCKLSRVEAL